MSSIEAIISKLAAALLDRQWVMATAESCTGGLIAGACTDLPGSSEWFERGFVSYSNRAKLDMLSVAPESLRAHGAVSETVAEEMARGACEHTPAQVSVAVTGIAGPGGGSEEKPVGTVCFAWCVNGSVTSQTMLFAGNRAEIRQATVRHALQGLLDRCTSQQQI